MSKQLLIEYSLFTPVRSTLTEGVRSPRGNMIVSGQVQACDKPNANNRIYPYDTLYAQVERYIEGPIRENRATGELDHPECLRPSAMILTKSGWKHIKDVSVGESVMTLNTDTNFCEWNSVERVVNEPYKGKAYRFKSRAIDTVVTPNHRFVIRDRYGKYEEVTAEEIYKTERSYSHHQIPKSLGDWEGNEEEYVTLPAYEYPEGSRVPNVFREKYKNPLVINAKDWYSFVGFYLAEGGTTERKVTITQNKGEKLDLFLNLLDRLSNQIDWKIYNKNEKGVTISTSDKRLTQHLSVFGGLYDKRITDSYKEASPELLELMYEWFKLGDGSDVANNGTTRSSVFSVSYKLIEDFNEILIKIGRFGDIKEQITLEDYEYAGHTIKAENKKTLYRLWTKKSTGITLDRRFLQIEEIDYDDTVHCVTVKNGNFYCKDQNLSFLSGNSSVINLKNVSHNIVKLWWEGKNLYGDIEILPTPSGNIVKALFESNITVGISSRAMGSTTPIGEGLVRVEEDLEIICWDFVSQPSTFGAYMKPLSGLRESVDHTLSHSKDVRISRLFSDIMCTMGNECCLR